MFLRLVYRFVKVSPIAIDRLNEFNDFINQKEARMNTYDERLASKIISRKNRIYKTLKLLEKSCKPNMIKKERCRERLKKQLNSVNSELRHFKDFNICRLCSGPISAGLSDSQPYCDICNACPQKAVRPVRTPVTQYIHSPQEGQCYFVQPQ